MTQEKTDGLWLMMHPNQWAANTEIDFGGGLYGYRKTGTITAGADERSVVDITAIFPKKIIDFGGYITLGPGGEQLTVPGINIAADGSLPNKAGMLRAGTSVLRLVTMSNQARTNAGYDIWVLYTKS